MDANAKDSNKAHISLPSINPNAQDSGLFDDLESTSNTKDDIDLEDLGMDIDSDHSSLLSNESDMGYMT